MPVVAVVVPVSVSVSVSLSLDVADRPEALDTVSSPLQPLSASRAPAAAIIAEVRKSGAGDALPLERARELGAATIVAIDVGSGPEADATKTVEDGIVAIHDRVFAIMSGRRRLEQAARWQGPPELVYVRPDVDGHSAFAFDQVKYFLEEGYRATRQALAARR